MENKQACDEYGCFCFFSHTHWCTEWAAMFLNVNITWLLMDWIENLSHWWFSFLSMWLQTITWVLPTVVLSNWRLPRDVHYCTSMPSFQFYYQHQSVVVQQTQFSYRMFKRREWLYYPHGDIFYLFHLYLTRYASWEQVLIYNCDLAKIKQSSLKHTTTQSYSWSKHTYSQ